MRGLFDFLLGIAAGLICIFFVLPIKLTKWLVEKFIWAWKV